MAKCKKDKKKKMKKKKNWEEDVMRLKKTELFFLLRLELLIKQQTYKQKSSNDK